MEKSYEQDLNHCKRVKLQNFESFKLKDNFKILIKSSTASKISNARSLNLDVTNQYHENVGTAMSTNHENIQTSNGTCPDNGQSISNINIPPKEISTHETTPVPAQQSSEDLIRIPKKRKICSDEVFQRNDASYGSVKINNNECSPNGTQTCEEVSLEKSEHHDDLISIVDEYSPTQTNYTTNIYETTSVKSDPHLLYDGITSPKDKKHTDIISTKLSHAKPMLPTKKWCSEWLGSQPKPKENISDIEVASNNISLLNSTKHPLQVNGLNAKIGCNFETVAMQNDDKSLHLLHQQTDVKLMEESTNLGSEHVLTEDLNDNLNTNEKDETTCTEERIKSNDFACNIQEREYCQTENKTVEKEENDQTGITISDSCNAEENDVPNINLVNENLELVQENHSNINSNEINSDENNSDESTENNEVRRSNRIKTILEKVKPRHFMRSVSNKSQDSDNNNKNNEDNSFTEQAQVSAKQTSPKLQNAVEVSTELPNFEMIDENIYLGKNKKSKVCKEIRHMRCECYNTAEEGDVPCGTDCLNRLLMIECSSRCPFKEHCTNKRFQRKESAPTEVFQTSWKGCGLRATSELTPGQFVMEYCGEVLNQFEFYRRSQMYAEENQQHFYFMALSQDEVVDATLKGNTSRFINHSCDPNCETQKWTVNGRLRVGFFAKRNIPVGEEITFDYQFERYGKEAQVCYCGSDQCRGYLGKPPNENNSENLKIFPANLSVSVPVESDKKERRKSKKWEEFENNTLEYEINSLVGGLQTTKEVLMLSRYMVRSETIKQKLLCLNVLTNTAITSCLRDFTRFHGLSLLWSWMVDLSASTDNSQTQLKIPILNTLKILPITSKNAIEDSKVLPMVQRWWKEETENTDATVEEILNLKEKISSNEQEISNKEENETEESIVECNTESPIKTVDDLSGMLSKNEEKLQVLNKYVELLSYLLDSWKDLKEIYRIPKRSNLLHEKLTENIEPDNDDLSSLNDSPLPKEEENNKSNLKHTSYRSRKEKNNRSRWSPEHQDVKIKSVVTDTSNLKWLYAESSTKKTRQEHRRQFERDQDTKKVAATNDQHSKPIISTPQNSQPTEAVTELTPANYVTQPSYIAQALPQQQIYPAMYNLPPQDGQIVYPTVPDPMYQEIAYTAGGIPQQAMQATYDSVNGVMYAQPIVQEQTIPVIGAQQPVQQNGVTILGSQSGQAIVLLSQEQLQQLTNQQPIAQQQQLVYPPIQTDLTQFQQLQSSQPETQPQTNSVKAVAIETEVKPESIKVEQPKDPRPLRLPPHWKTATDAEGSVYYYHTITRKTQWDPPSWNKFENIDTNSSDSSSVAETSKKGKKVLGENSSLQETNEARKYREAFRKKMSQQIVSCLSAYRRPDCKVGRITSTEDFKHLARKITHEVLMKEIKQVQVWEDLEVNSNTKHKAKEYVHKYMSKMGAVYKVKDHKT